MFEMNKSYSREDIHNACGGDIQSFLPIKNGKVVAACIRPERNLLAPDVIICNNGSAARAAGKTLAKQAEAIPVFIKLDSELFKYVGDFSASESLTTPIECAPYAQKSGLSISEVSRVIKMTRH
ncbi:hypothetical protein ACO0K7_15970 [Undibacterium sp. Ji67W]|uniref:hypothetical protein n=1 Tax=Undibacterium sp. Ji67W TaxID=3413042 RepID=UPI003BF2BEE1